MSAFLGMNFEDNGAEKEAFSNFGYIGRCPFLQINSPVETDTIRITMKMKYNIRDFILYIFSFVNVEELFSGGPLPLS